MRQRAVGLLCAAGVGLGLAGAPRAEAPPAAALKPRLGMPLEGTAFTNPEWVAKPSAEDFAREYPTVAQLVGLGGRVSLVCKVGTDGLLSDCTTQGETPTGMGFGTAALRMAASFRMRPKTVDGVPVGGASITVPIRFSLQQGQVEPVEATTDGGPVSTEALTLAHRLLAAIGGDEAARIQEQIDSLLKERDRSADGAGPSNQATAVEALRSATAAALPTYREQVARKLAGDLPLTDLRQAVAFMESPAGHAYTAEVGALQRAMSPAQRAALLTKIAADARSRFCAKVACMAEDRAPAPAGSR